MRLKLVENADTLRIFEFERSNQQFFSENGIYRNPLYYQYNRFIQEQAKALEDQNRDMFYMYLIIDDNGNIAGRLTIDDVIRRDRHRATLTMVVGEGYDRDSVTDECVAMAVETAKSHRLTRLEAFATVENISWQIALLKGGFRFAGKYSACKNAVGSHKFTDVVLFEYNF